MCFDRWYHSPMKFLNIRNSKKIVIFFSWYQHPPGLSEGQNTHFPAILGMIKSVWKIFLLLYCSKCFSHASHIKSNKKTRLISQRELKNWKIMFSVDFKLHQACPRTQIFTFTWFLCMTKSSPKIFLLLNCSIGLPHTAHKK